MDPRQRLFRQRDPYATDQTASLFLAAVRANVRLHQQRCPAYAAMLNHFEFNPDQLVTEQDLAAIPVIPTLYFKRHDLFSMPAERAVIRVTSSGTQGLRSTVIFDWSSLLWGIRMMITFFARHHIISPLPANYLILNEAPGRHNPAGAARTSFGTSLFAPAVHRTYALKRDGLTPAIDLDRVMAALHRYARQGLPVRFVGFPAFLKFLLDALQERHLSYQLNRHSRILLGGGWKQHADAAVDKEDLFRLAGERLGISREHCHDFYSAVEHPIPYCACSQNHFHVPVYSRVIIRDPVTLAPLPAGQPGLLSFITPLVTSMPLVSVMTDDLAVLYDAGTCLCGNRSPAFAWLARSGVRDIRTCAASAADWLGEVPR